MTRAELIDRLTKLTDEARDERDLLPAVAVLLVLRGALHSNSERELMDACCDFSTRELERLTGQPDWSENTLRV